MQGSPGVKQKSNYLEMTYDLKIWLEEGSLQQLFPLNKHICLWELYMCVGGVCV